MATAYILGPIATVTHTLSTPVHPTLFPIPLVPILHAARVSLAFRGQKQRLGSNMSWGADMAGFLMMCWGGGILTNTLLGLPIPQILSYTPWAIYGLTHMFLTTGLDAGILPTLSPKFLDTSLPLIDAIARSAPIVGAVESCRNHANPAIQSSLFVQFFLGAVAAAGGGMTAVTLGVWEHDWRFRRPPFVDGGFVATLDLWSGAIAAGVYGLLQITHPWYGELYEAYGFKPVAVLTPLAARSVAVTTLTAIYGLRAYLNHYSGYVGPGVPKARKELEKKSE